MNIRAFPPMSPAAKRGPPISVLSKINWRFSPATHRLADGGPLRVGSGLLFAAWHHHSVPIVWSRHMQDVTIVPVRPADAAELIRANLESRDYHAPWVKPFTDRDGFDNWFGRIMTGPNLGFVAREGSSGAIVG